MALLLVASLLLYVAAAESGSCPADSKPRCTSTENIALGAFSGDTWVPDSGCFVAVPSLDEVRRILRGSWLLMCGGSNTGMTAQAIVRQLAPQAWEDIENHGTSWVDLVLRGSDRVYLQGNKWLSGANETALTRSFMAAAATTAPYSEDMTRVTLRDSRFYPACSDLLQECGVWYNYRSIEYQHAPDVEHFLAAATPICDGKTASGPGTTACFVVPSSCAGPCSKDHTFLSDGLRQGIARSAERDGKYSFHDITLQIGQRQEEFPRFHVTAFLALWQFWGLLNTLPEAARVLDLPGSGGLACPTDAVIFEPRCKMFDGGRKTLHATWEGCDGCDCTFRKGEEEYYCASRRNCGYALGQGGRPDRSDGASGLGLESARPSPPIPPPSPPPISFPPASPGEAVVSTVVFSLRLRPEALATPAVASKQNSSAQPSNSPASDERPKLSQLLQAEQADAIRAAIAGRLPSTIFHPSDVLLHVGGDVLTLVVVIPEGSPTAGLLARALLMRETPKSLTALVGLLVDKVVMEPVIEPMTMNRSMVRARAAAAAQRPCQPDVAAGLLAAATDLAPRHASTTSRNDIADGAAARWADPAPRADSTEGVERDGCTATILLVVSTAFALAAASAQSVGGWLRCTFCALRTRSKYSESSVLISRDTATVQAKLIAKPSSTRPEPFLALNGARLLAGVHIVVGHMYQSGYGGGYPCSWGFSWVPWFFMLSGYVLTLARHASSKPEAHQSIVTFVRKRAAVIYPPYAVTLFVGLAQLWWEGEALPRYYHLAAQGVLAQSFVPWLPENTVQMHCWFLSCLVPYWLGHDIFVRRVVLRLTSLRSSLALLLALAALGFLPLIFPASIPGGDPEWYRGHHTGSLRTPTDFAVVFLKFHPLAYLHTFAFGAVLARVRHLLGQAMLDVQCPVGGAGGGVPSDNAEAAACQLTGLLFEEGLPTPASPPLHPLLAIRLLALLFRLGASLGYFGLVMIFNLPELRPISFKLSARLSVLMLLQGLVLVGLTPLPQRAPLTIFPEGHRPLWFVRARCWYVRDPMEAILARSPAALGDLSYAQYLIQFLVLRLWPRKPIGSTFELLGFFGLLLGTAQLLVLLVVRPAAKLFVRARPSTLAAIAFLVSLVTSAACLADDWSRHSHNKKLDACGRMLTPPPLLPPYLQIHAEALDIRLNWTASALVPAISTRLGAASDAEASLAPAFALPPALINPSLLWLPDGRLLRAARLHATGCLVQPNTNYNGSRVTKLRTIWLSEIAVDAQPPAEEAAESEMVSDGRSGGMAQSAGNGGLDPESGRRPHAGDDAAAGWATWDVSLWSLGDSSRPLSPLDLARGHQSAAGGHREGLAGAASPAGGPMLEPWAPLCQREAKYVPSNHSLVQTVVTGAEDPKLILLPSGIGAGITFSSFPPHDSRDACHDPPNKIFGGSKAKYQMFFASPPLFGKNSSAPAPLEAHTGDARAIPGRVARRTRMAAGGLAASAAAPHPSALGYRFQCQNQYHPQKNWIGFSHAGVLHMITSVTPHTVQTVREDGQCLPDSYLTDGYEPLHRLAKAVEVRGTATAIPWRNGTAYLALLHTKNIAGMYTTMAYTFEDHPPFTVTAVSRPVPFAAGSSAFASSLSVPPGGGKVVIGYGAADAEARALVVSTAYLESLFDWSGECGSSGRAGAPAAEPATGLRRGFGSGEEGGGDAAPMPASATAADPGRTARAYQYAHLVCALTVWGSAASLVLRLALTAQTCWRMVPHGADPTESRA